jgi:hypothetical protein
MPGTRSRNYTRQFLRPCRGSFKSSVIYRWFAPPANLPGASGPARSVLGLVIVLVLVLDLLGAGSRERKRMRRTRTTPIASYPLNYFFENGTSGKIGGSIKSSDSSVSSFEFSS